MATTTTRRTVRSRAQLSDPAGMGVAASALESAASAAPSQFRRLAALISDPQMPQASGVPSVRRAPTAPRPSVAALRGDTPGLADPFQIDPNETGGQADARYQRYLRIQDALEKGLTQGVEQQDPDWQRQQAVMDSRKLNQIVGSPEFYETEMNRQRVGNDVAGLAQQGQARLYNSPYGRDIRQQEDEAAQELARIRYVQPAEIKAGADVNTSQINANADTRVSMYELEQALAQRDAQTRSSQISTAGKLAGEMGTWSAGPLKGAAMKPEDILKWYESQAAGAGAASAEPRGPAHGYGAPGAVPAETTTPISISELRQMQEVDPDLARMTLDELVRFARDNGYALHP